jgi:Zn-dependent protease
LNPIRHVDPLMTLALPVITILLAGTPILAAKPVPFNPYRIKYDEYGAAMLAAAGPLANLGLAIVGALASRLLTENSVFLAGALTIFTTLNVALFVFNLLPIPPLDGSRVLYAFAPESVQRFMRDIEPYGFVILIALIFTGILGGLLGSVNNFVLNLLP